MKRLLSAKDLGKRPTHARSYDKCAWDRKLWYIPYRQGKCDQNSKYMRLPNFRCDESRFDEYSLCLFTYYHATARDNFLTDRT